MTMQVLECGQTDHQLCNESLKIFVFCELGCLAICPRRHFFLSCQCSKVDAKWMGLLRNPKFEPSRNRRRRRLQPT